MNPTPLIVSVISASKPAVLSKTYWLDAGQLRKQTGGQMVAGDVRRVYLDTLQAFAELLGSLRPNQALAYGLPTAEAAAIRIASDPDVLAGKAIARTRQYFTYGDGAGVLMLDYDPPPTGDAYTRAQLLDALYTALPELQGVGLVWYPSASSHITNAEGLDLTGLRGQRVYIGVTRASDIPAMGKTIEARLWAHGYGYMAVSGAGTLLKRCAVDTSVWQPERLDFAGGAACQSGLQQRRGDPYVIDGQLLDHAQLVLEAATSARAKQAEASARQLIDGEATAIRERWLADRARLHVGADATDQALTTATANLRRTLSHSVLMGDFVIQIRDKERKPHTITIADALAHPHQYHGLSARDPLEPDYNNGKYCAKLYLDGRATLYTQAHGGKSYSLIRQPKHMELVEGELVDTAQQIIRIMAAHPDLYQYAGQLVRVQHGRIEPLRESDVLMWLGANVAFYTESVKPDGSVNIHAKDAPIRLVKTVLEQAPTHVKELTAVMTSLVLRPDGSVLNEAGYDKKNGYLLDTLDGLAPIPHAPTPDEVLQAVEVLMRPFSAFPYETKLDRSVLLAALLTAVVRPSVDTRPAFAFDAPAKGSGKTLLAKCIARLVESSTPKPFAHTSKERGSDEETRKRLFSILIAGEPVAIWDNITGDFDSASFASILTAPMMSDRLLGQSRTLTARNNTLFLLTGNNLCFAGELPRRILKCRIDPDVPRPYARRFDLNPEFYCRDNRHALLSAAAVIIRGWLAAKKTGVLPAAGELASFEQWDALVRQPIAWLGTLLPDDYTDVMAAIDYAYSADPEAQALANLYDALAQSFHANLFTAKDAHRVSYIGYDRSFVGEAFEDVTGKPNLSIRSLGRVLAHRSGRIAGNFKLQKLGATDAPSYRVTTI